MGMREQLDTVSLLHLAHLFKPVFAETEILISGTDLFEAVPVRVILLGLMQVLFGQHAEHQLVVQS